ncbi:MAG: histidine kinase dimerization/phospho-acceptor domain-containing protein, partial [Acidimicrobiia bacterium]
MATAVPPRRFRTRLSAAFLVVAGVTSGLLALGSLLSIREYRYRTFNRNADNAARLGLLSAPDDLSQANFDILLDEFRARAGFETVAWVGDRSFSSSPHLGAADIPAAVRAPAAPGALRRGHTTIEGTPYLVIGGTPDGGAGDLFFFFDRRDVLESVRQARDVLAIGWVLSVSTAALVGHLVARRTLRPVGEAAEAARSLADGLLETRLQSSTDDEFGAWAQAFNRMAAALEEKIGELSAAAEREKRFTADVAHDLRTPLASLSSAASLLADELDRMTPRARALSQLLIDDVRRLESLVLELLELARLDAG